jgi:hypothetical protein
MCHQDRFDGTVYFLYAAQLCGEWNIQAVAGHFAAKVRRIRFAQKGCNFRAGPRYFPAADKSSEFRYLAKTGSSPTKLF